MYSAFFVLCLILSSIYTTVCLAQAKPPVAMQRLQTIAGPNCQSLEGVWQGSFQDVSSLFLSGFEKSTVLINVEKPAANGYTRFYGIVLESSANNNLKQKLENLFVGYCYRNQLTKTYLLNSQECGHFGPPGLLASFSSLELYLPYENAMTETNFRFLLQKEAGLTPEQAKILSSNYQQSNINKITTQLQTCH